MKNNKILILLILLLQVVCVTGFAQKCNQGQQNKVDNVGKLKKDSNSCAKGKCRVFFSFDPNEIIGLEGYNAPESTDTLRWVSAATQSLTYTIYFENDAELAMAASGKVNITTLLHEKLDFATFEIGNYGNAL